MSASEQEQQQQPQETRKRPADTEPENQSLLKNARTSYAALKETEGVCIFLHEQELKQLFGKVPDAINEDTVARGEDIGLQVMTLRDFKKRFVGSGSGSQTYGPLSSCTPDTEVDPAARETNFKLPEIEIDGKTIKVTGIRIVWFQVELSPNFVNVRATLLHNLRGQKVFGPAFIFWTDDKKDYPMNSVGQAKYLIDKMEAYNNRRVNPVV
jgi:hypothetical protein